jgi:outer membrane protein assembly factor BamB
MIRFLCLGFLSLPLFAQTGWRGNATGNFLDADVPTSWAADSNIAWKTALPAWSNSHPLVLNDRIFICAEPDTLICLDKASGKILWQKANPFSDSVAEADRAKAKEQEAAYKAIRKKFDTAHHRIRKLQKEKKKNPDADHSAADAEIKTLQAQKATFSKEMEPYADYAPPKAHGATGFSTPTPVSDGKLVFTAFGNGVAAAYDFDGNRKWLRYVQKPSHGWGHSSSPLLSGGKLIIHVDKMFALDPETGKTAWESKVAKAWGSPIPVTLEGRHLIVTPSGDIIDSADGKVLVSKLARLQYNTPVWQDGVLYFMQNRGAAYALAFEGDALKATKKWDCKIKGDRYYASPVIHDGIVYAINKRGHLSTVII